MTPDGELRLHFHAGQFRAWESPARFISVIAGAQSGKTEFGPHWMRREMEVCGPGDYLIVTPTYPLLVKKALPAFLRLFKRQLKLGDYQGQQKVFTLTAAGQKRLHGATSDVPTQVFFGHAQDPDSLESATAKAAWLDEAGQKKFRLGSWEAVQRRLAVHEGRALITTTPYDLGWLKQEVHDRWRAGDRTYDVVRFDSTANPAFPQAEFERARRTLPRWKFDLFYRGIFTRPAGMIYDCFQPEKHTCPRFAIPDDWPRWVGLDFGGVNTAAVFVAEELAVQSGGKRRTGRLYLYRVYGPCGGKTARQHAEAVVAGEARRPSAVGGSGSEDQWRNEFAAGGLAVREPPVSEVEVGINRVYGALAREELVIFDDLRELIDDFGAYSREVDELGNVGEKIEDKETWHRLDAVRYVLSQLRGGPEFKVTRLL